MSPEFSHLIAGISLFIAGLFLIRRQFCYQIRLFLRLSRSRNSPLSKPFYYLLLTVQLLFCSPLKKDRSSNFGTFQHFAKSRFCQNYFTPLSVRVFGAIFGRSLFVKKHESSV